MPSVEFPDRVTGKDGKSRPAIQPRSEHRPRPKPSVFITGESRYKKVLSAIREAGEKLSPKYVEPKRVERIAPEVRAERLRRITLDPPAANAHPKTSSDVLILHRDFRTLDLEPDSVDLIFTDSPYSKEFLSLWSDLAAFAGRVLKH